MKQRNWVLIGVAGVGAAALLGLMVVFAVIGSANFVIFYASHGPIPGQKVARPVEDFARPSLQELPQAPESPAEEGAPPAPPADR